MKTLLPFMLLALGCGGETRPLPVCVSDDQCDSGQLCFAEGCGDPAKNVVVEVEGGSLNGQYARDIPLSAAAAITDLPIGPPLSVSGEFQRERSASSNPLDRLAYTEAVVVRAVGQSMLLPGITRIYEERFTSPERGSFEMRLGYGDFVLTAMPADRTVPPVVSKLQVPDSASALTFVFPSVDGAPALTGQLIKKLDSTLLPPEPVLVSTDYTVKGLPVPTIDLQLFDVQNQPLSQRFPAGSTGEFAITISPEARTRSQFILVAAPREPGVAIPTKRFLLQGPVTNAVALEYGDYGDEVEIGGTILDVLGSPVVGAQVVLEGTVVGDGTFRSKIVETNVNGDFKVKALGSKTDSSFQLTVVPPKGSRAASSQRNVGVKVTKDALGAVSGTLNPTTIRLEDRLVARGQVNLPGGDKPAPGVFVRATLQVETRTNTDEVKALPIEPADTVTLDDGTFELPLDPGVWRFEYVPGGLLPLSSRLVTIKPAIDANTGLKLPTQDLSPVELSFGRTVQGTVTGTVLGLTGQVEQPVPYSQLRFFRVTSVEGRPASILLGTTIADDRGRYQVVLPSARAQVDAGTP